MSHMKQESDPLFSSVDAKRAEKERRIRERIERERRQLMMNLANNAVKDVRTRTAFILRDHPDSRNSDKKLVPEYWKVFDRTEITGDSISFDALAKVTPWMSIVRARQKIQNEYGLFLGDVAVARQRRWLADEQRAKQRRSIYQPEFFHIYSDESGKTDTVQVVGSVWISGTMEEVQRILSRLRAWKKTRGFAKEIHFSDVAAHEIGVYIDFFKESLNCTGKLGFKAVGVRSDSCRGRSTDEVISELYYRVVTEGARHEVESGRATLPRVALVYKDRDEGTDALGLAELRDALSDRLKRVFDGQLLVQTCQAIESSNDELMQLADLFTGAANRRLNRKEGRPLNHKDELAETLLGLLNAPGNMVGTTAKSDTAYIEVLGVGQQ